MASSLPPLNPLRAFEVTARYMSFTLAANELCVTQGAVSRQVKALEDHLGFQLFARGPRGLSLTPSGRLYAAALTESFEHITNATEELVASQKETSLTVRGYTMFLNRWLLPKLPDFQMRHPNIKIQLQSAGAAANFSGEHADVAIRYGKGRWRGLVSDSIFRDRLTPVCSPEVAAALGPTPTPSDLLRFRIIHLRRRQSDWSDWFSISGIRPATVERADNLYLEELAIAYECAMAGHGFALGQLEYLSAELADGRLVTPFSTVLQREAGYYLVVPTSRADISTVVAFRNWMREQAPPSA